LARILIVEDDNQVRKMMRLSLEACGHQVSEAENGEEAVESCAACLPDLMITDILMPVESGLMAIARVRKLSEELPILAISGGGRNGRLNFLSTARTFPNVRTLGKPFDNKSFIRMVEELLGGSAATA